MASLTLRLDDTTRDALESLAAGRGKTTSDVVREAIDQLLGRATDASSAPTVPQSLTLAQRRMLALQHEILAVLTHEIGVADAHDRLPYHRERIEVLSGGFTGEYGDEFELSPELSRRECRLTWDLLNMFRVVGASLRQLDDEGRCRLGDDAADSLRFRGFDGNDEREGALLSYARHLLRTGRWSDLQGQFAECDGGNSHWPMLGHYLRMLEVYQSRWSDPSSSHVGANGVLSAEDLRAIADAQR